MLAANRPHPLDFLTEEDYQELKMSGLTDEQIVRAGHFSIGDRAEGRQIADINHRGLAFCYLNPVSGEPYRTPKGKPFHRMKPRDWAGEWNSPIEQPPKYLSPKGSGNKPYFSPLQEHFNAYAKKTNFPVFIVEGEKKADCLTANGFFTVGLAGVHGWLDREARGEEVDIPPAQTIEDDELADEKLPASRMLPELVETIDWHYRHTNIVFDSDASSKAQVRAAMQDLAIALKDLKADPHIIRLPNEIDGSKNGPDDFLVRHGLAAFKFLEKIAKPAFKKQKFHFPKEPAQYEKFIMAWAVLKDSWRFRPGVGWYNWTGTHWVVRTTAEFQESVSRFQDAQGWEFPVGKDLMLYQLQCRMLVSDDRWNPTHLLGFANGVLSVKDGTFTPGHNREDFLTSVLPYEFDPSAQCPTWLNFLHEALNGDQEGVALLQAFIKWVLLPKAKKKKAEIEKCLDLLGTKGSGKGTFLDTLIALVGSENVAAISPKTFESSTHLADLLDKKLSIDADAFGFLANVGLFNKVVSNEPVSIKRLYKDPVTTRLGTVIVRAYNRVLEVPDGAEGLDRRIVAIHFNNRPEVIDLELSDKLQQELPGIFAWAWSVPMPEMKRRITWAGSVESVASASIQRFEANNPEYSFLKLTFPTGSSQVKASDLYHSYQTWCKEDAGISPKKRRKFSEALQALGCDHKRTMDGYFYSIPSMNEFDVVKFLGLSKKILLPEKFSGENVHNVHAVAETPEKSVLSGMNILPAHEHSECSCPPENVHEEENPGVKWASDPPFEIGETFQRWGENLRVEKVGRSTLYCHIVNGTVEQNSSYIRVPFEEAEKIKNEHSQGGHEHSNVHIENRMFMPESTENKGFQTSHEHYEHSQPQTSLAEETFSEKTPSWTKAVFAAVKEQEPQPSIELEFPYLGCEVNRVMDGERKSSWVGFIRQIDGDAIRVWWTGDWELNRNNKPIQDKDGQPRERWTLCRLDELCPRPVEEAKDSKRNAITEARNQKFIDQAIRRQKAIGGIPNANG